MKQCPKCNLSIPKNAKKCQYCGVTINKKLKDKIEKQPDIIKEPNKITETESLETTIELEVNTIPLKVKPVKAPKSPDIIPKEKIKIHSSIKIAIVVLLFLVNTILIIRIVADKEENIKQPEKNIITQHTTSEILGNWRSSNNGLFAFEDNKNFFWYEYYDDLKNNYYSGTYNYKKGLDAIEEMGYTEEEFNKTFGEEIKIENVYSMNLLPTYSFKAGNNMTEEDLKKDETWWYILMIKNDGTAIAYNKTLDLRYNLVKN